MEIIKHFAKISVGDIGAKGAVITDDSQLFDGFLNTLYLWAGIVCVIIIIVAGFLYVIGNGNAARIKRAREAIRGAITGLIVILLAFVITQFVIGRF